MEKTKKAPRFTVKALIVVLIIGFLISYLFWFHSYSSNQKILLNQEKIALSLAQKQMNFFRSYKTLNVNPSVGYAYADITSGSKVVKDTETSFCAQDKSNILNACLGTNYTVSWKVTNSSEANHSIPIIPAYKTVEISTSWIDKTKTPRLVSIASIISSLTPRARGESHI